jgi:hypothetical protein
LAFCDADRSIFFMPKLTVQVRTHNNLLEVLAAGESAAWRVGVDREPLITHVRVVNFDGTQMIEGVYDRAASHRRESDNDLTIGFLDGRIVNCKPKIDFDAQNPVRFIDG